jgi:hypothetical protein
MTDIDDPRELGGSIGGPGGPFDEGGVVIDATKAILVDHQTVSQVDKGVRDQMAVALLAEGRINQSEDRASVVLLLSMDGLAALVTEIHGITERAGYHAEFKRICNERWKEMPH